jgi:transposase
MTKNSNKQVQKVNDKETETLFAVLTTATYQAAAEKLGITYEGLWKRMKKFGTRETIAEMPKQALERLQIGSIKAANELVDELDHHQVIIRQTAATEVLDRVGISNKPQTLQQINIGEGMGVEFINEE